MITLASVQILSLQSNPTPSFWKPLASCKGFLPSRVAFPLQWNNSSRNPQCHIKRPKFELGRRIKLQRGLMTFAIQASESKVRWVLEPVGDGDSSHLDEAVPLPGAVELSSDAAIVGRLPSKSDIVIPVATVSGLHARLEKREGSLFVTDLDSTNGTFIDNKKLRPGAVTPVLPGSYITFGDEHLAAFRLSKLEEADTAGAA
ncbi:hypothetical protein O6H91_02G088500 [Diphasiastrum complanatum]|uniref:Uncharacterized protein n=1 Tax=Diphasiastrum complanatum TaxID=34168 RepID=A0ACC2EI21_DIPCM|nr:hypothetical protein O6H91_Y144000 [Diphasiastrum complanatum]KAJ7566109.1 hypothetical protein O6H91_02G088500 [Diphasiastrum complanatum]